MEDRARPNRGDSPSLSPRRLLGILLGIDLGGVVIVAEPPPAGRTRSASFRPLRARVEAADGSADGDDVKDEAAASGVLSEPRRTWPASCHSRCGRKRESARPESQDIDRTRPSGRSIPPAPRTHHFATMPTASRMSPTYPRALGSQSTRRVSRRFLGSDTQPQIGKVPP